MYTYGTYLIQMLLHSRISHEKFIIQTFDWNLKINWTVEQRKLIHKTPHYLLSGQYYCFEIRNCQKYKFFRCNSIS